MNAVAANAEVGAPAEVSGGTGAKSTSESRDSGADFARVLQEAGCSRLLDGTAKATAKGQTAKAASKHGDEHEKQAATQKHDGKQFAEAASSGSTPSDPASGAASAIAPAAIAKPAPSGTVSGDAGVNASKDRTSLSAVTASASKQAVCAKDKVASLDAGAATPGIKESSDANGTAGERVSAPSVEMTTDAAAGPQPHSAHDVSKASLLDVAVTTTAPATAKSGSNVAATVPVRAAGTQEFNLTGVDTSNPNRIEVGLNGGSLGWLSVRAELRGDQDVHAMLRGSAETAGALKAQSTELAGFLQAHSVNVASISIESARVSPVAQGFSFADSASPDSAGSEAGQGASGGQSQAKQQAAAWASARNDADVDDGGISVPLFAAMQSGTAIAGTGSWLSVRV